jgi:uncharacterized membrane protein YjfL (UPF0719 family)
VNVYPNFRAVGGTALISTVIGALLTIVLVLAVLMLVVSAAAWALGTAHGNPHTAQRGKTGVLVALGGATLAGAAIALMSFFLDIGNNL